MPLLYEEKEFIHQEEIMYTVFILDLRKRNGNRFETCLLPPAHTLMFADAMPGNFFIGYHRSKTTSQG